MGLAYSGSTMSHPLWRSRGVSSAERAIQLAWYSQNEILLHSLTNTRKVLIARSFLPNFALFLFSYFPAFLPFSHFINMPFTYIWPEFCEHSVTFFLFVLFLLVCTKFYCIYDKNKQESLVLPPFLILPPMLNFIRTIFYSNVHNLSSLDCYQLWERTFPRQDIRSGKLGI